MSAFVEAMEEIRRDDTHGAAWLSRRAAEIVGAFVGEERAVAARVIRESQPTMAPMWTLARRIENAGDVAAECRRFIEESETAEAKIAEAARELIEPGMTVMTHSSSGAVEAALARWAQRVIATESAPAFEGRAMAERLRARGVKVMVVGDDADVSGDLLVVGADAISPRGVVNKIGTRRLVGSGRVPAWCLASWHKVTPEPLEVAALFDETPLDWFSGYLSERGPLRSPERIFHRPR